MERQMLLNRFSSSLSHMGRILGQPRIQNPSVCWGSAGEVMQLLRNSCRWVVDVDAICNTCGTLGVVRHNWYLRQLEYLPVDIKKDLEELFVTEKNLRCRRNKVDRPYRKC
jgi:hypothetical protein